MPAQPSFDYAVLRVVPRVDREEFLNAGVIVFCLELDYLGARVGVDAACWKMLWPEIDIEIVRAHLDAYPKVCAGEPGAGPIARLSRRQRFHLLSAPRSTVVQVSPVHTGLTNDPQKVLDDLFDKLVRRSAT